MKRKSFTLYFASWMMALLVVLVLSAGCGEQATHEEDEPEVTTTNYNVLATEGYFKWAMEKPGETFHGKIPIMGGSLLVESDQLVSGSAKVDIHNFILDEEEFEDTQALEKIREAIRSPEVLHTDSFPHARLEITGAEELDTDQRIDGVRLTHNMTGKLTIKDVTNKIQFQAFVRMDDDKLNIVVPQLIIDRTKWGIDYKSKTVYEDLEDDYVNDNVKIRIRLNSVKG